MLIRLDPKKVRLGMFLHSFEGSFADRPFWQSRFVLTDPADLERLRQSAIEAVVVDTSRSTPAPARASRPTVPKPRRAAPVAPRDPDSRRVAAVVGRAKRAIVRLVEDVRLGRPIAVAGLAPIVADLFAEVERNANMLLSVLRMRSRADYTYVHSVAVSALMMNVARTLRIDEALLSDFGMAGLLHDVGKIAMPDTILNKPGPLTAEEFAVMKRHPRMGRRILRAEALVPAVAIDVCLNHHERIDGTGYPFGQTGDMLSLAARVGAICDVYDALTADRAYKDAWTPQQALTEMQSWEGHFDPELLSHFIRSLGIYPVGTLVRVGDSALAIVIGDNLDDPTRPTIRSFYSISAGQRVPCEDVAVGNPTLLQLEQPTDWGLEDWPGLRHQLLREGSVA